MREYVTGHVLRHHLGMDRYICNTSPVWAPAVPPLARDRKVGILGLGALGRACAQSLVALNFQTLGWSRNPKDIEGVRCYTGEDGLREVLAQAEILVLLLPATADTENTLDAAALAQMPHGAAIINPGRGALIDDAALLAALETGHISHATLDVFRVEPLPDTSPIWPHANVTVTPHIASETRAHTASDIIAENIKRCEAGQPLRFLVDRSAGY
jgi:glyoxylate/hydroxypyruvate reductase A